MKEVTAHDLVKYGIIPELIGRLPVITALSGLDTDALVKILTVPKNSIVQQYKKLLNLTVLNFFLKKMHSELLHNRRRISIQVQEDFEELWKIFLQTLCLRLRLILLLIRLLLQRALSKWCGSANYSQKELLQTNSVKLTQKDAKKRQKRSTAS